MGVGIHALANKSQCVCPLHLQSVVREQKQISPSPFTELLSSQKSLLAGSYFSLCFMFLYFLPAEASFPWYWAGALGRQSAISSGGFRPLCKGGGWGGGRSSTSLGPLLNSTNVLGSIAAPSSTMTTFLILLLSLNILIKPITPSTTSFFIFP